MASKVTFGDELLFPSEYIAAFDLNGKDLTLTIESIEKPELRLASGGFKKKGVIKFKEHPKKFVLNVTNANSIEFVTGESKSEKWIGRRITLYTAKTPSPKGIVDCLRVRETKPQGTPPPESLGNIHPGWFEHLNKAKIEIIPKIFEDFVKKHTDIETQKLFGDACDRRVAELKAETI